MDEQQRLKALDDLYRAYEKVVTEIETVLDRYRHVDPRGNPTLCHLVEEIEQALAPLYDDEEV